MDRAAVEQLLDEMLSSLEDLETKAGATLQFLKDKGLATDKDLAAYLEQAGNASNVRRRAARLRMMSLLSSALKNVEEPKDKPKAAPETAKAAATPEPASAQPAAKSGDASEEIQAELAQATKTNRSEDDNSFDAGEEPRPDSSEPKNAEPRHPVAEAKARPKQAQPDESVKNVPPPENSEPTRNTDRPAPRETKEDAA